MSVQNPPVHPGVILKEHFLLPNGVGAIALAKHMNVDRSRVERIIRGDTPITMDTAIRLAKALNNSPLFWLDAQIKYDSTQEENQDDIKPIFG